MNYTRTMRSSPSRTVRFVVPNNVALASTVGAAINPAFLAAEEPIVRALAERARLGAADAAAVQARGLALVQAVREARPTGSGLDAFLREYHLASPEGVILMCLAEALLRIPDAHTADRLIADKIAAGSWEDHLGDSESLFVNASTWGLMLTGSIVDVDRAEVSSVGGWFARLASRISEPVARAALRQAMRILGHQFVMGRTIEEALERTTGTSERAYRYSFDMLGEAALTEVDAEHYFEKYRAAIVAVGRAIEVDVAMTARHSISVKLSALHPRYEFAQRARVIAQLAPRPKDHFIFEYDFGDGWEHRVVVEAIADADPDATYPRCLAGKRACPPEDCGGPSGYAELLRQLGDSNDEEHEAMLEWAGPIDPDAFSLAEANRELAKLAPRSRRVKSNRR